jgi:hypothetical protein
LRLLIEIDAAERQTSLFDAGEGKRSADPNHSDIVC